MKEGAVLKITILNSYSIKLQESETMQGVAVEN